MFTKPERCPNPNCQYHHGANDFYVKKGYYKTKHDHQPVPRYRCKACGRWFGSHTFQNTFRQHKPEANEPLFKLLSSGVTMRRAGKIVGVTKKTVARKLVWLAEQARQAHREFLN